MPCRSDADTATELLKRCPVHAPTPLLNLPALAATLGVATIWVKDEGCRSLGSFKSLGGVYAGLRALARATGLPITGLIGAAPNGTKLPMLVCASDGNHGLAVSAAARLAGTTARIYLPSIVSEGRVARIAAKGADVVRVPGTYDDAVRAAADAARNDGALLIADTGNDPDDPVLADVLAGYGVMADEITAKLADDDRGMPTHLFVQAGVGGLAAAMAARLHAALTAPARIVVVEPEAAASVAAALAAKRPVLVTGTLETQADMLSCGEVSAPALPVLLSHGAVAIAAPEAALGQAPGFLADHDGPRTTPSGAAGLAGLRHALADSSRAASLALSADSRILLLVTEASLD